MPVGSNAEINGSDEERVRRPIREYLAALDSEDGPTNPERAPKALSPTDPCAAWTTRGRHKVMFGYSLNYLIDMDNAVIVDVEATPTRISKEVDATETMIERTQNRFALKPKHIAADVAYGTGEMLGGLVDREIEPHIPVWDKGKRDDGTFSREDFVFDVERDVYSCPGGKTLPHHRTGVRRQHAVLPGQQTRLRTVPVESPVLSQITGTSGPARRQPSSARPCASPDGNRPFP